jgi:hypothetical protein
MSLSTKKQAVLRLVKEMNAIRHSIAVADFINQKRFDLIGKNILSRIALFDCYCYAERKALIRQISANGHIVKICNFILKLK